LAARGPWCNAVMTPLQAIRRLLLVILVLGLSGTVVELILLGHYEDGLQWIPLVLVGTALATLAWHAASGSDRSADAVRIVMVCCLAAGLLGVYLHYGANVEFQHETDPSLSGRALLWKVLQAKAPPALAPGVMIQLGLIGLAYTHRHREN